MDKLAQPVTGPVVWRRQDLIDDQSWIIRVAPEHAAELDAAVRSVEARGLRAAEFTRDDFPLPTFSLVLAKALDDIQFGRGVVLFKGLPMDSQDEERAARLIWGIGTYLGRGLKQHARVNLGGYKDDMVAHIVDQGLDYNAPNVHGSATGAEQRPHCDPSDLVALMCMRPAVDGGGVSQIVSAMTIYNELLKNQPDVIDTLYEGFYHDLRNQAAEGTNLKVTPYLIPVYSYFDGHLSCNFNSKTVETAAQKLDRPLPPRERAALDAMIETATRPDLAYDMTLETGDLQVLNNYTMLHCRSGWKDPADPKKKRMMLRLWLRTFEPRPLAPGFAGGYVTGAKHDVGAQVFA